jgi:hypothetical protein
VSNANVLTFVHRFLRTLQCQMRVIDCPPARGCMLQCTYEWTGRPKPGTSAEVRLDRGEGLSTMRDNHDRRN